MIVFSITRPNGDVEALKTSRTKLTVGGAYTDDITLLGQDISPEHGVFHVTEEVVVYTDNGFGTLVNNREIIGQSVPVSPEDSVRIGEVVITCRSSRDEITSTREPISFEANFSDRAPYPHSKPDHTPMPSPPETEILDSISTAESTPSWMEPQPDPASSETSDSFKPAPVQTPSSPGSDPYEAPSGEKLIRIPSTTPRDIEIDNKRLAITIVVLMFFFWPFGLLVNFLTWMTGDKRGAHFGYIKLLMFLNFLILLIVAYFFGGWVSS